MKNFLFALVLLMSISPSFAGLNMKPGLWDMKTNMKAAPGEVDPMQKMKDSLAKLTPEQRAQVEAMLAKQGITADASGAGLNIKACYTAEMIQDPASIAKNQQSRHCATNVTTQTAEKLKVEFKCPDGSKGTGEWNFHGGEQFDGSMKFTDAKAKTSTITQNAKFLSSDCGSVKPLVLPSK